MMLLVVACGLCLWLYLLLKIFMLKILLVESQYQNLVLGAGSQEWGTIRLLVPDSVIGKFVSPVSNSEHDTLPYPAQECECAMNKGYRFRHLVTYIDGLRTNQQSKGPL